MRIETTHAYNLIRVLRAVIPVIVVGLLAVPVWNYFLHQTEELAVPQPSPLLVEEVSEVTESIQFVRTEAGRTVFTIDALRNLGMADGTQLFEGVQITIAGQDASTPDRLIDSDNCGVDDDSGNIGCTGNIEIQFDNQTFIRTTEIGYNNETQTITASRAAQIVRSGVFEANAGHLVLRLTDKIVEVSGSVSVTTEEGITLNVDGARYYESENRIELVGGLRFGSSRGQIRARRAEVILTPETFHPEQVALHGSVAGTFTEGEMDFILGADSVGANLSDGIIERVVAAGAVVLETIASNGRRVVIGGQVEGFFDGDGVLQVVESTGNGRLVLGDGQELRSDWIRNEIVDSIVRTATNSVLSLGEYRMDGDNFVIRDGAEIQFESQRPSLITFPSGTLRAPVTSASFDPEEGTLRRLVQTGGAEFIQGGRRATADRIDFVEEFGVRLSGNGEVSDVGLLLNGDEILLSQDTVMFEASGSVRLVLSDDTAPVLIEGGHAQGNEHTIVFSSSPELWREKLNVTASTSIEIEVDDRRFKAVGDVVSIMGSYRVEADQLDVDDVAGIVRYSGTVRGRSPELEMEAAVLELFFQGSEIDRVVARESVVVENAEFYGRGDIVEYVRNAGTVILTGNNAEVVGRETGSASGPRIMWNVQTNALVLAGDEERRAVSTRRMER